MLWNSNHIEFLRKNYPKHSRISLCEAFNAKFGLTVSVHQITSTLKRNKITSGRNGQFEKGYTPWHAGTNGKKCATSGTFTKGVRFKTHKSLGDEVFRNGMIYIKGDNGKYTPKKNVVWENHHRKKIKDKHRVVFIDGDKTNFKPENLLMVNRSQLAAIIRRGLSNKQGDEAVAEKLIAAIEFHEKV